LQVIIDSHAHLLAPASLYAHRSNLIVSGGQYGDPYRAVVSAADLEKSAGNNVALMDDVGTDMQLLSPRPFLMLHGITRWEEIVSWTMDNNDIIARTIKLYPRRFRGVAGLPQALGKPISSVFDEMQRCIDELGFVGVLLNPDPSEGRGTSAPLGDPYWYPLYERLCELDLPAHVHSCQCGGRETYDEHFISEESLAITSLIRADIFKRYPSLKLMVSHGGGAIPFQVGRWRSNRQMAIEAGRLPPDTESFDATLRRFWFDTVVHNKKSLELLFDVVGAQRCLFGTERPGSGGGKDPATGRPYDDLKPVIQSIVGLSAEDRLDLFERNARRFFKRLGL
jgi:4-oxalmesaconate hydratase